MMPERPDTNYNRERPVRANAGRGVQRLEMNFRGKRYATRKAKQFIMKKINKGKKIAREQGRNDLLESFDDDNIKWLLNKAVDIVFTQMSAKQGIKKFGERAVAAIIKEFKQLNDGPMEGKSVIGEVNPDELTPEQKKQALAAVNLIKLKRNGNIKGRTCANGSKQRRYLRDGESVSSPTVSLEALITSLITAAIEERDVASFDVPGAYLHARDCSINSPEQGL